MSEVACTGCGRTLRVQPEWAGKNIKCPQCATVQRIAGELGFVGGSGNAPPPLNSFADPVAGNLFSEAPRDVNPYASPTMPSLQTTVADVQWQHLTIGVGQILEQSWSLLTENFGACLLVGLIMIGVHFGKGMIEGAINSAALAAGPEIEMGGNLMTQIFDFLVTTFVNIGAILYGLKLARRQKPSPADLFAGGPFYMRGLGLSFLIALAVYGAVLLGCLPAGVVFLMQGQEGINRDPTLLVIALGIGLLPATILSGWLAMRWFVALVMLIDRDAGVFVSLADSAAYMNGSKMMAFLAMLLAAVIGTFAMLFTCGLGLLAYMPFLSFLPVVVYFGVTGQEILGLNRSQFRRLPSRIEMPAVGPPVQPPQPQVPPSTEPNPFGPPKL